MIAFILRRLLASIGVLIAVGLIAFAMFRYVGDPVNQMVGIETSVQEREQLRHQLGLDQPTIVQAARFLVNAARFDFGVSYQFKQPVADLIGARMPATLELALVASILSLAAGVPMGVYHRAASRQRARQAVPGAVADRHIAADIPDRHFADLSVRRRPALAAVVRPRRCGAYRLVVDDRPAHGFRAEVADHALDHARRCSR